jgi:chromate transporter
MSLLYALGQGVSMVDGILFGIKAAVLVIVIEALIRIGKRALKTSVLLGLAAAAFVGIFFLALPFPLIVAAAALIGFVVARQAPGQLGLTGKAIDVPPPAKGRWRQFAIASLVGLLGGGRQWQSPRSSWARSMCW